MFFRRRKNQTATPPPAPAPELTGEQIFELLNGRLADFVGEHGQWTLVRRTDDDTDRIFHAMLTHEIAADLTREVLVEQYQMREVAGIEASDDVWVPAPLEVKSESLALPAAPTMPGENSDSDEANTSESKIESESSAPAAVRTVADLFGRSAA